MENQSNTSQLQKNAEARDYRCHAKKTFKLVKVNFYRNDARSALTC